MKLTCPLVLFVAVAFFTPFAVAADALHSPWDNQHIALTDAPYTCPDPPPFTKSIDANSYYTDANHSIIDPALKAAEEKATEAPTHLGQWATEAADAYLTKGSRAAATCVYTLLDAAARAKAWSDAMPTNQGSYEQKWLLAGSSVAYLKVRNTGVGTADQDKEIRKWLGTLANRASDYIDSHKNRPGSDAWNNHRYWAGLAVAAAGVAINDRGDFEWGVASYKAGVDQIQPNGALPLEMERAGRALHYHLYALAPLVMLAELGEANGMDLYAYDNGALHRLARLCIAGLSDPGIFAKGVGVTQDITAGQHSGADIGWAVPYVKRFPNPQLSAWIAQADTVRFWQWGGLPPGADL